MPQAPPSQKAGIYIHIPFCRHKCLYCDFYSLPLKEASINLDEYVQALLKEWELRRPETEGLQFHSLYLGGGTPSLLSLRQIALIIDSLGPALAPKAEITLEANPETIDDIWLKGIRSLGVNRISLGIQSLSPQGLEILCRPHGRRQALMAIEAARLAGFTNISVDIIFGWPGQRPQDLEAELHELLGLNPEHISCYELTIEEGTLFASWVKEGRIQPLGEESLTFLHRLVEEILTSGGFKRYEISNYALKGRECRHNLIYWENRPYLGLGAWAVSYLKGTRSQNPKLPLYLHYLASGHSPPRIEERLDLETTFRETTVLGLRLIEGISISELKGRFGIDPIHYYKTELEHLMAAGLIEIKRGRLRLTKQGRLLADEVGAYLV